MTPEDTIVRALNDLTQALKDRRNTKGTVEYEALQRLDELINKIPTQPMQTPITTIRRVTFDPTAKPAATPPRVQDIIPPPRVQDIIPPPRVQLRETMQVPRVQGVQPTIVKATIDKPIQREAVTTKPIRTELNYKRTQLRDKINDAKNQRSRLA